MEYDELPEATQMQVQDALWGNSEYGKETTATKIDDWLADHGDEDWDAGRWIEEAKNASL